MATLLTNVSNTGETTKVSAQSGSGQALIGGQINLVSPASAPGIGNQSGGSGVFDRAYGFTGTVTAGTPFTINLNTGTDQFGNTLAMAHCGRVHVLHQGSTGKIVVGAGTNPVMLTDRGALQPGGACVFSNNGVGYAVTSGAVSGVSPVEAMPVVDSSGTGTFNISAMGITTGAITYSATVATLLANINGAFNSSFGSGVLVASGASLAAIVITGASGNYQYNAFQGHFTTNRISGSGFTINGLATGGVTTTTTAGVAAVASQADTITITADVGTVPFSIAVLGRTL